MKFLGKQFIYKMEKKNKDGWLHIFNMVFLSGFTGFGYMVLGIIITHNHPIFWIFMGMLVSSIATGYFITQRK